MSKFDYVMGYLTADGTAYKDRRGNVCSLVLELSDEQIVKDIAAEFNKQYHHRSRIIANKERNFYRVTLNHKDLPCDANSFKNGRAVVKAIYDSCENKYDFVRGLFDGDACVSEVPSNHKHLRLTFSINSGCPEIKQIIDSFCDEHGFSESFYFDKRGSGSWYNSINDQNDVMKFFNLIYGSNTTLFLKRKYDVFISHGFPNLVTG